MAEVSEDPFWRIIKHKLITVSLGSGFVYCSYRYLPLPTPAVTHLSDHLLYALKWQLPSVLVIYGAVIKVILKRVQYDAHDPLKQLEDKAAADTLEVHRRFLSNTIEQYVINGPALLMLSLYLTPRQLKVIPPLVALFVAGRVIYLHGYLNPSKERTGRTLGFIMTIAPSAMTLAYVAYRFGRELFSALM